jgi:hypothetical protein
VVELGGYAPPTDKGAERFLSGEGEYKVPKYNELEGLPKKYSSTGQSTDGWMTQKATTNAIEKAIEEIPQSSKITEIEFDDWMEKKKDPGTIYVIEPDLEYDIISNFHSQNNWAVITSIAWGDFIVNIDGEESDQYTLRVHKPDGEIVLLGQDDGALALDDAGEYTFEIVFVRKDKEFILHTETHILTEPPEELEQVDGEITFVTNTRPIVIQKPDITKLVIEGSFPNSVMFNELELIMAFGDSAISLKGQYDYLHSPGSNMDLAGWDAIVYGFTITATPMQAPEGESIAIEVILSTNHGEAKANYWTGFDTTLTDTTVKLEHLTMRGRTFVKDREDIRNEANITYWMSPGFQLFQTEQLGKRHITNHNWIWLPEAPAMIEIKARLDKIGFDINNGMDNFGMWWHGSHSGSYITFMLAHFITHNFPTTVNGQAWSMALNQPATGDIFIRICKDGMTRIVDGQKHEIKWTTPQTFENYYVIETQNLTVDGHDYMTSGNFFDGDIEIKFYREV